MIGRTPLVRLHRFEREVPEGIELWAKAEWQNPGGSVKDRAAARMILEGEASGKLTPGRTILDATSGNTGIAYAMVGAARGYSVKLCVPANASPERKLMLRALGAELVLTNPLEGGTDGAIREARRMYAENPDKYFYPDQYNNDANWRAHYDTTGPEILRDLPTITHFVAGLGTSGTLMGAGRFLREKVPDVSIVAAEPRYGELVYGLRNIDEGFVPELYDDSVLTSRYSVSSYDALRRTRDLIEAEGVFAGVSSGAALHVAMAVGERAVEAGVRADIAFVVSDGGWKYLSTGAYEGSLQQAAERIEGQLWA